MTLYAPPPQLPRAAITAHLDALRIGDTTTFARNQLAPAYRGLPSKLAREYNRAAGRRVRTLSVGRDSVMFVRVE